MRYAPTFRARAGSIHGYDVVDHNSLNPEIGNREDFEEFVATLRAHQMGHILDIVPNHVGIMGSDNLWWMDVLESGEASAYAEYFDIDWTPANPVLAHKVLVPTIRFATYPSTGLPVKLSQVAYLASHRMPGTNSSTKTKSVFIASCRTGSSSRAGR